MKKFIKKNRIVLTALLLVILLVIALISGGKQSVSYKLNPGEALALSADSSGIISPVAVFNLVSSGDKSMLLVDIRNRDEFTKGHIENALNIPVAELLGKRALEFFEETNESKNKVLLYGQDQLQAHSPWLLLRQVGYNHILVMQGGYDYYSKLPLNDSVAEAGNLCWQAEKPVVDTSEFRKKPAPAVVKTAVSAKKPVKVVPVKQEVSSGGGC